MDTMSAPSTCCPHCGAFHRRGHDCDVCAGRWLRVILRRRRRGFVKLVRRVRRPAILRAALLLDIPPKLRQAILQRLDRLDTGGGEE